MFPMLIVETVITLYGGGKKWYFVTLLVRARSLLGL